MLAELPEPDVLPVFVPLPVLFPLLVFDGFVGLFPPSVFPFPGAVTFAGELSSSTFILSSLPEASFVTAYIFNSVLLTVTIYCIFLLLVFVEDGCSSTDISLFGVTVTFHVPKLSVSFNDDFPLNVFVNVSTLNCPFASINVELFFL